MKNTYITESGVSVWFVLFVVFFILKLTGTITWSWWMVTLPLWICPAFMLSIFGIILGFGIIFGILYSIFALGFWIYDNITN